MSDDLQTESRAAAAPNPLVALGASTLSITLASLPVFLMGALAVFIRDDLDFGEAQLGLTASLYYLTSALSSTPGGRVAERVGPRRGMAIAAVGSTLSMLGIAVLAQKWWSLTLFMMLAGMVNGIALPASNLALARGVPVRRQGIAFGVKQSSGPFATLLAGSAVPILGLTIGWRWAFVFAAFGAIPLVVLGFRPRPNSTGRRPPGTGDVPTRALMVLAAAGGFAVVGGSSLGAFYVESAVSGGIRPGLAGTLLAMGSAVGIIGRVAWGWVGDRRPDLHVTLLTMLLAVGSLAFIGLGQATEPAVLALVTIAAFVTGWGWPALLVFSVVLRTPKAPAIASGIVATGIYAGGIFGPTLFGTVVEQTSYGWAWLMVGVSLMVSASLMWTGGRMLEHHTEVAA